MLVYGSILEMKQARGAKTVTVVADRQPNAIPGAVPVQSPNGHYSYQSQVGSTPDTVLRAFLDAGIEVQKFEVALPTLNEVFIEEVSRARQGS